MYSVPGGIVVIAMPFTAGSTANLADAILALGVFPWSATNNPITVDLESNSSGLPGSILATLTQQGTIPPRDSPGLVTFDYSGASVQLTAGIQYWIVTSQTDSDSDDIWLNSNSDSGTIAYGVPGSATGPWVAYPHSSISAFQVDGASATTPEPASLLLFGTGLLGLAYFARRRKNHGAMVV